MRLHGINPADGMVVLEPRKDECTLRTEDILRAIEEQRDSVALVLFSGVQYYTGQFFAMEAISKAAHKIVRTQ